MTLIKATELQGTLTYFHTTLHDGLTVSGLDSVVDRIIEQLQPLQSPGSYLAWRRRLVQKRTVRFGLSSSPQLRLQRLFPSLPGKYVKQIASRLPLDQAESRLAREGYERFRQNHADYIRSHEQLRGIKKYLKDNKAKAVQQHRIVHYLQILTRT